MYLLVSDNVGSNNFKDCAEVNVAGFALNGKYTVNLGGATGTEHPVYCYGKWTTILNRGQFNATAQVIFFYQVLLCLRQRDQSTSKLLML